MVHSDASNWIYSSVKVGDEKKKGVEREWRSEYKSEFSIRRLKDPMIPTDHEFYKTPRTIKSDLCYADHHRVMSLEKKLGQRVKERSRYSTNEMRRAFKLMDKDNQGSLSVPQFLDFLNQWHIDCSPDEVKQLLRKYDSNGNGRIDYQEFLAFALPNDFQRRAPDFQALEHRGEWVKWNNYRVRDRGAAPS